MAVHFAFPLNLRNDDSQPIVSESTKHLVVKVALAALCVLALYMYSTTGHWMFLAGGLTLGAVSLKMFFLPHKKWTALIGTPCVSIHYTLSWYAIKAFFNR